MAEIHSDHTFEASWRQPEDVDRYLRKQCNGRTLNLCSGQSPLGDIQLDADRQHNPDILADMNNVPFGDRTFDTVVFDPPWKLNYFDRQPPFFEAVRVCKLGGRILFNARWIGTSRYTEIEEIIIRADDPWANVSTIAIHRREPGQQTVGDFEAAQRPK